MGAEMSHLHGISSGHSPLRPGFPNKPALYSLCSLWFHLPSFPALQPDQLRRDGDLRLWIGELAGQRLQRAALLGGARLTMYAATTTARREGQRLVEGKRGGTTRQRLRFQCLYAMAQVAGSALDLAHRRLENAAQPAHALIHPLHPRDTRRESSRQRPRQRGLAHRTIRASARRPY